MTDDQKRAFDQHYRENFPKVFRLGFSLTGSRHDAEEVAQEAFLQAFRAFPGFRGESAFFTWIYRIAVRCASGRMKRRDKQPYVIYTEDLGHDISELYAHSLPDDPESKILANETKFRCLHCITELLPHLERKVFCLSVALDLSYRQIAEILETTEGAVKTAASRARKHWHSLMDARCECFSANNPCRCSGWAGLMKENGSYRADVLTHPHPEVAIAVRRDIGKLCNLRATYQTMYRDEAGEKLVERVRKGIAEKEFQTIFPTL